MAGITITLIIITHCCLSRLPRLPAPHRTGDVLRNGHARVRRFPPKSPPPPPPPGTGGRHTRLNRSRNYRPLTNEKNVRQRLFVFFFLLLAVPYGYDTRFNTLRFTAHIDFGSVTERCYRYGKHVGTGAIVARVSDDPAKRVSNQLRTLSYTEKKIIK